MLTCIYIQHYAHVYLYTHCPSMNKSVWKTCVIGGAYESARFCTRDREKDDRDVCFKSLVFNPCSSASATNWNTISAVLPFIYFIRNHAGTCYFHAHTQLPLFSALRSTVMGIFLMPVYFIVMVSLWVFFNIMVAYGAFKWGKHHMFYQFYFPSLQQLVFITFFSLL